MRFSVMLLLLCGTAFAQQDSPTKPKPEPDEALRLAADAAFKKGELDQARRLYQELIKRFPRSEHCYGAVRSLRQAHESSFNKARQAREAARGEMVDALRSLIAGNPDVLTANEAWEQIDDAMPSRRLVNLRLGRAPTKTTGGTPGSAAANCATTASVWPRTSSGGKAGNSSFTSVRPCPASTRFCRPRHSPCTTPTAEPSPSRS